MSDKNSEKRIAPETGGDAGNNTPGKKKRPLWLRILKVTGFTLLALVVFVLGVLTVAVTYLQPERLTPIVEKYANDYLDADVKIGRVELSFWSTFPKFEVDIRDLAVRSKALDRLPAEIRSELPAYSDSLLSLRHFNAGLNIPKLSVGKIALYDVILEHPAVNIVQATPELSNLDIFPESEEKKRMTRPCRCLTFQLPHSALSTECLCVIIHVRIQ